MGGAFLAQASISEWGEDKMNEGYLVVGELPQSGAIPAMRTNWQVDELRVLILEEPTRGVDLGARKDIYRHLRELSDNGLMVIVISSDAEVVAGLSDSSAVLKNGQSVARFDDPQTPENLMRIAGSSKAA